MAVIRIRSITIGTEPVGSVGTNSFGETGKLPEHRVSGRVYLKAWRTDMAFSTTSFFAGVGTVFAAITIGFAGGALISTSPKMEPNRLERVAAGTSVPVAAATKTEKPEVPSVPAEKAEVQAVPPAVTAKNETPETKNETPETTTPSERVVSTPPAPASQPAVPPQPQPAVAREDVGAQIDNAKKLREGELRKQAELRESDRRAEQRRERRKRQEIDAAVDAVKRMQRDGVLQQATQQDEGPRFGFFGHD
jgi:hypothetical protein